MSDFLDDLGRQLVERARQDSARRSPARRSRRTLVLALAVLALVAVPAAAVTGVFKGSKPKRHLSAGPGLVDLGGGCKQSSPAQGKLTSDPPPPALIAQLAVLRRPQQASDRLPNDRLGLYNSDGVNPDYVRRVRSSSGVTGYLVPALNVRFMAPEACPNQPAPPAIEPQSGVCLRLHLGVSCASTDGLSKGLSLMTSGGSNHGTTLAAAVVPDGITTVIWRVRRGKGFLDTMIPVRDNVIIGRFPGRNGHGLYVLWVDASGKTRQVLGPHRFTANELRQLAHERALDRAAGPKPRISPSTGTGHTLFELRMRIPNPKPAEIYGVTVTGGMPGDCSRTWVQRIGMTAGGRGEDRGLMRAAFGVTSRLADPLCPGRYNGVVRKGRSASGPVVGRFHFDVT